MNVVYYAGETTFVCHSVVPSSIEVVLPFRGVRESNTLPAYKNPTPFRQVGPNRVGSTVTTLIYSVIIL